jgi:alpha/beta hydrolase family protein
LIRPSDSAPSHVITLVHGTWARGAPWTQPDSPFCCQLRGELTGRGATRVEFFRFDWSGKNTHEDRRIASVQLRKQLLAQFANEPHACHYVVAHSHGGNVALRAVRRSRSLKKDLSGVVAIATPFLTFTKESFTLAILPDVLTGAAGFMAGKLGALLGLMSLLKMSLRHFDWSDQGWSGVFFYVYTIAAIVLSIHYYAAIVKWSSWLAHTHVGAAWLVAAQVWVVILGVGLALYALRSGMPDEERINKLRRASRRIFRRYSYLQPEDELARMPIFTLSSLLDEARGVLVGSWWMHRVTGWVVRVLIVGAIAISVMTIGAIWYGMFWLQRAVFPSFGWLVLVQTATQFVILGGGLLAIFLAFVLVNAFLTISDLSSPGLGLARLDENLLWDVRARRDVPSAIRSRNVRYSSWQLLRHASRGGLFHSRIYFYHPAIKDMAEWMSSAAKLPTEYEAH